LLFQLVPGAGSAAAALVDDASGSLLSSDLLSVMTAMWSQRRSTGAARSSNPEQQITTPDATNETLYVSVLSVSHPTSKQANQPHHCNCKLDVFNGKLSTGTPPPTSAFLEDDVHDLDL